MVKHMILFSTLLYGISYGTSGQGVLGSATVSCTGKIAVPTGFHDEKVPGNSVPVGENPRYYGVYVPDSYDPTRPSQVIFDFHGANDNPTDQYNNSMYYLHNPGKDYLVVYPMGINSMWQGAPDSTADDFAFIEALLPHIEDTYCVDTARIFASGKSQGGGFVDQLACSSMGDKFAAFAMASPALYQHYDQSLCSDKKPRKILESHGANDKFISYSGGPHKGGNLPRIREWVWWWAQIDSYSPQQAIGNESPYSHVIYSSLSNTGVVEHYHLQDLGHCWPQAAGSIPNTDYTRSKSNSKLGCDSYALDFTDVVVKFFEAATPASIGQSWLRKEL